MIKKYISLILLFSFISFGFGQNVFSNEITDSNPSLNNPYDNGQVNNPNIVASGISRGSGIIENTGLNRYNARSWDTPTIDLNAYFEFSITPNTDFEIDFSNFEYTSQVSGTGPTNIELRSSIDGFTSSIGLPVLTGTIIDLTDVSFQNINSNITFRLYAWNASGGTGTFSINDFAFNGVVSLPACSSTTTWNGTTWNNGPPTITTETTINGDYDTSIGGDQTSFSACSLTVMPNFTLTIADNTFIEVHNEIVADGDITVAPSGSVVQVDDTVTVSGGGTITVNKRTALMSNWYEYTYWSSPVQNEAINDALATTPTNRRFLFNAQNYLDATAETNNDGSTVDGQDDIDDDGNAWELANGGDVMTPGVGYASTHLESLFFLFPGEDSNQFVYPFQGPFNNGEITVPIYRNDSELNDYNWNFIGNPYPSAIDADAFLSANTNLDTAVPFGVTTGAIFLWSQNTAPDGNSNGNENLNFSQADYAIINATDQVAGGDEIEPNRFIPSGQGFFVAMDNGATATNVSGDIWTADVFFNNSMRVTNENDLFFRNTNNSQSNKIKLNLTSDNGVFNQISVAYVDGATNSDDGMYYDAQKNSSSQIYSEIYSRIDGSTKKFAIQGKDPNTLDIDEIINLGFSTNINVPTLYTISIAQFEGDFMSVSDIYLKDNLLNTFHDLKASDYNFTSEVGEFNNRFEIVFNADVLSTNDNDIKQSQLIISEHSNGNVRIALNHNKFTISNIEIIDITGRQIYNFKAKSASDIYDLSNLNKAAYIARVSLSNGQVISKKAIKQN